MICKKIKKKISSITGSRITLTNNEIIVFRKQRNFIKRYYQKYCQSRRRIFRFSQTINGSWFTINEKCIHSISQKCFDSNRIISRNVSSRRSYSKKIHGSSKTALIISNEEKKDIMKIVKSLEESGTSKTIKNEAKRQ